MIAVLGISSGNPLYVIGQLYVIVLVVRAISTWFPLSPSSPVAPLFRVIFLLTEPLLRPFRRLIPPIGMFDISFLVAFIVVEVFVAEVLSRL